MVTLVGVVLYRGITYGQVKVISRPFQGQLWNWILMWQPNVNEVQGQCKPAEDIDYNFWHKLWEVWIQDQSRKHHSIENMLWNFYYKRIISPVLSWINNTRHRIFMRDLTEDYRTTSMTSTAQVPVFTLVKPHYKPASVLPSILQHEVLVYPWLKSTWKLDVYLSFWTTRTSNTLQWHQTHSQRNWLPLQWYLCTFLPRTHKADKHTLHTCYT